jgi:hypothetical protein
MEFKRDGITMDVDEEGCTITVKHNTHMYNEILSVIGMWGMRNEKKKAFTQMIAIAKQFGVTKEEMIALLDELK